MRLHMIRAESLTKRFGAFTAIQDVTFQVERGEIVGFLGPNGAGKSTTMRILGGVFPPTRGRAIIAGHDVVRDPLQARQAVGYFPERVALYFDLTVREYLNYVADMKGIPQQRRGVEVDRAIDNVLVSHMAHRMIGTLSKGYRQRVGIAQALIGTPPVLILDEPTAGLDPEQVTEVRKLILQLRGESTVILSTHILSEVEAACDRVIIINEGRILAVDTPRNLTRRLRRLSQIHIEVIGPADEIITRLRAIAGVEHVEIAHRGEPASALTIATRPDTDLRGTISAVLSKSGWTLLELRPVTLSLEEIFLTLVHENSQ